MELYCCSADRLLLLGQTTKKSMEKFKTVIRERLRCSPLCYGQIARVCDHVAVFLAGKCTLGSSILRHTYGV